ncbi:COG3179 Predicted chitinase [uncultured Caudovirales phage]|uniref:COG3179 Predicted chitinase n=1 Tax=uncultured Caudovirales phage TaxID=2100421 RepID=A0A6J5KPJ5_9CAUD|nr:COG3179 Predicted chitinase [uncultured Caudovirales phage]
MLTKDQLLKIAPAAKNSKLNLDALVVALNDEMAASGISNVNRKAGFIAQCAHESGGFCRIIENLNYSADGLLKTFPKYFPDLVIATQYAKQPAYIANRVYANRMGNGAQESGDGFRYRGRGFIQLTGKENYTKCGDAIGKDLVNMPELLENIESAVKSAAWFWNSHNLNALADADDIINMTKKINGGTVGLEERKHYYEIAKNTIS